MTVTEPPGLPVPALGQLMPMFLWLDGAGKVLGMGPTLLKVTGATVNGADFAEHFALRLARPKRADTETIAGIPLGVRLHLVPRARPEIVLRGSAVRLEGDAGILLNLTFGIHLVEAVRMFELTEADFGAADLAIEMLYLGEANAAVLGELRALTGRLELARRTAVAQARSDPLTGLANRRGFDRALDAFIQSQALGGAPFAVAHVDLDYFKSVNDTYGHAAGDSVLMQAATRLARELRRGDIVARTGGDEFLLLLQGADNPAGLRKLGERLILRLEEPFDFDEHSCRISASVGIAVSVGYGPDEAPKLLEDADFALYAAKHAGRGKCVLFSQQLR